MIGVKLKAIVRAGARFTNERKRLAWLEASGFDAADFNMIIKEYMRNGNKFDDTFFISNENVEKLNKITVATSKLSRLGEAIKNNFLAAISDDFVKQVEAVTKWILEGTKALEKFFSRHGGISKVLGDISSVLPIVTKGCLAYFKDTAQSARLMAAAYASRGQSVDFGGSNTTLTMQLKTLATIDPDPNATETLVQKAKAVGADMYVSVDGVPCVFSNGANEFFDNVYNDIWLKTALQVAGFNALRNAASKIPQTAAGVEILVKAYTDVLNTGIKNGAFAAGKWTLPVTFGDPQMLKDAVESVGYYVYATPIEEQAQSEREERKAPFIQMAIKRAGAIHTSDILVYINN